MMQTTAALNGHISDRDSLFLPNGRKLFPAHRHELHASGVSDETIRANNIYSESDRPRLAQLVGWKSWSQKNGSGLCFDFVDEGGRVVYTRVKPTRPPNRNGKPLKYISPKGASICAYFPAGVRQKIDAGAAEVVFTEGEKKSLSAAQIGLACIGLTGVDSWHRKGATCLLPELTAIDWRGRTAYIAFDSDAAQKSQVKQQETILADRLKRAGAIVKIIRLPSGSDGAKVGLDDYIVSEGPLALRQLMDSAEEPDEVEPESLMASASEMDPAKEAKSFLNSALVDGTPRLVFHQGKWLYWINGGYREQDDHDIRSQVIDHLEKSYYKVCRNHTSNVIDHLQAQAIVHSHVEIPTWLPPRSDDDPPPVECAAAANGIIHLPSYAAGGESLRPATPRFFSMSSVSYRFDAAAPEPRQWKSLLEEIFDADQQSISTLQEWFGYCLTPDTRQQKMLWIVGPPRSSKGVIASVLAALVGRSNIAGIKIGELGGQFGLWPLVGKSLAILHDVRLSTRLDHAKIIETILTVTGEGEVSADRKGMKSLPGRKLNVRFLALSNELPIIEDNSGAFLNRIIFLSTPISYLDREDVQLVEKLLTELPGIFLWAIQGWKSLRNRGRFQQPDSALELRRELADIAQPVAVFIREECTVGTDQSVAVDELYSAWNRWSGKSGRFVTTDKATFGRDLFACEPMVKKVRAGKSGDRTHVYRGIALRPRQFAWETPRVIERVTAAS